MTTYAIALLNASTGPIVLDSFKLGSAYDYLPAPSDTDIHGALIFTGAPSVPFVANANIVKYSIYLDYSIGDFQFGEFGLFIGTHLFALGSSSSLIGKIQTGVTLGNSIRLDIYLSVVGTNYEMWFDLAESDNRFRMAILESPDVMPPSSLATPNVYIIQGADSTQSPMIAYTDRLGLWNFDAYQYATVIKAHVVGSDSMSVTIALADYSTDMLPTYFGQIIMEFITGALYSICRYVKTLVVTGSTATLGFNTPILVQPQVGDMFQLFKRNSSSTTIPNLPIATATMLGGIKIGAGLIVALDGTTSVDAHSIGLVTSVNGQVGDVVVNATNLPGLATVGKTGNYSDLIGLPAPYALPVMSLSVRGGAKLPPSGNLIITSSDVLDLSFPPVKTVNSVAPDPSGNVNLAALVTGLVDPTAIGAGADLNTFTTTGLFTIAASSMASLANKPAGVTLASTLEVVPLSPTGTGDSVQRLTNATAMYWRKLSGGTWSAWLQVATNSVATTTSLGVVQIGSGINVSPAGVISVAQAIATTSSLGSVQIGSGLFVTPGGVISVDSSSLAVATTTTVGVVKIGSGISVAPDGTISVSSTLPIATTTTLGGIVVGSGLSITSGGILTANVRTVNGNAPDGSGNITVGAITDPNKLDRVSGIAQGILLTFLSQTISTGAVTFNKTAADVNAVTFSGSGAVTWTLSGWPASGIYAELQVEVLNGSLRTHTFPAAVKWVNPDGTTTTSFSTYLTNQRGTTNFQVGGVDFVVFWTRDGGTTIYGRIM